jgi:hypothetical protein
VDGEDAVGSGAEFVEFVFGDCAVVFALEEHLEGGLLVLGGTEG